MSTQIGSKECKDCGSSDACKIFQDDDKIDSYCFACETYFPPEENNVLPIKKATKTQSIPMDTNLINSLPTMAIADRKLRKETVEKFNVKVAMSETTQGVIDEHYYPDTLKGKLIGYEVRKCQAKQFKSIGDRKGEYDLWGQSHAAAGRKLFITEGRLDAMSLYQAIVDVRPEKYSSFEPAVVSLTRGVSHAVKDLMFAREFTGKYTEVVLAFDQDAAGEQAAREVLKVFPRFKVATFSENDPSAMVVNGKEKELYQSCVWDASYIRQGQVVDVEDIMEKAMERPKVGIPFPWPTLTKACFGVRPHHLHVVAAAPKIGKTDWQHQMVHHLCYSEGQKVGIFDLENSPVRTAKKIASKEAKLDFTRPDKEYDDQFLRDSLVSLQGKVRFYDRGASRDWSDIRVAIEEMHLLDGINIFMLDPITALISRYSASEANDKLNEICTDMADLVSLYPITIFCFSHVNPKPKGSKPHEAGAKCFSSELTGSRAIEKWFHYGHGIARDRTDDCPPEEKNVSKFYSLFDREYGQSYNADVYYDEDSVSYLETTSSFIGWKNK
jgi:twinkle protein